MGDLPKEINELLSQLVIEVAGQERESHKQHIGAGSFDIDTGDYIHPYAKKILDIIAKQAVHGSTVITDVSARLDEALYVKYNMPQENCPIDCNGEWLNNRIKELQEMIV